MDDFRAHAADRYLTWQEARRDEAAQARAPRRLGASPVVALAGAVALALGLGAYQAQLVASPLTIAGAPKNSVSPAQRLALDGFAAAPALTASPGLRVAPAYGVDDEDCVIAGRELICRR
ncbi:MAG: hypothetical protein HZY79_01080 [Rhodoblastus sp.]|nr:MAG: hypothetical protein HZY79_01080 [Rhodoblastus sp.]